MNTIPLMNVCTQPTMKIPQLRLPHNRYERVWGLGIRG